jgi:hypothetical protein
LGINYCTSIVHIVIPNAVNAIEKWAYSNCLSLTTVTLGNGLEEIGEEAFINCTSLVCIIIPPAVKKIHDTAFKNCSNLTNEEFCDEIEEFVSCAAMRGWWNQGVHEKSLSTYCFLVRSSIPERLGLVLVRIWQASIYDMLSRIPTFSADGLDAYFDTIDSKLFVYENSSDAPELLELAIPNDGIVQRVLSYLIQMAVTPTMN